MNKVLKYLTVGRLIGLLVSIYLFCWFFVWRYGQAVAANPTPTPTKQLVFHEDFASNLDKWELLAGAWSMWNVVDGRARAYIKTGSTVTMLAPKHDFWEDLGRNYEFTLDYRSISGVDKNIAFGYVDANNWYELHFNNSLFNLVAFHNGMVGMDYYQNYFLDKNQHQVRIKFLNGRIRIWIDADLIADVEDDLFTGETGRILLRAGTGASYPTQVFFDNVQVFRLLGEVGLDVDEWKQSDPLWGDVLYDQMDRWSDKPTIRRWGCAMVSAAMIMKYWGYEWLDKETRLTPETLNNWLKSQKDGFGDEGKVNFLAITRLVRQLSEARINRSQSLPQLPKLEYGRNDKKPFEVAKTQIELGNPVILGIDGHFLVADGVIESNWQFGGQSFSYDLLIKDPAYVYNRFSQHKTNLLSVRLLTPSYTDLSYLRLVLPTGVTVEIRDQQGNLLDIFDENGVSETICPWDEEQQAIDCTQRLLGSRELLLPKPESGVYRLSFTSPTAQNAEIKLFAYDDQANVEILPINLWLDQESTEVQLNYDKKGSSVLIWTGDWGAFKQLLYQIWQGGGFKKQYVFRQLLKLVGYAERMGVGKIYRYNNLIAQWLEKYRDIIGNDVYDQLLIALPKEGGG